MNKFEILKEKFGIDINEYYGDNIRGGIFNKMKHDLNTIDFNELLMGIEIEMKEHSDNPYIAMEIALDHLFEHPGAPYYTYLKEMEEKLEEYIVMNKMNKESKIKKLSNGFYKVI
jgi:hypothetical protein